MFCNFPRRGRYQECNLQQTCIYWPLSSSWQCPNPWESWWHPSNHLIRGLERDKMIWTYELIPSTSTGCLNSKESLLSRRLWTTVLSFLPSSFPMMVWLRKDEDMGIKGESTYCQRWTLCKIRRINYLCN